MKPEAKPTGSVRQGLLDSLPVALSYVPFGAIFGMLSLKAGLTAWQTAAMSLFVYTGAAQLTAVSMIREHAGVLSIILTTLLLSTRHLLMGLSLAPHYRRFSGRQLNLFGFFLTDEAYALTLNRLRGSVCDASYVLTVSLTLYASWSAGTWIGTAAGGWLPDPESLGLGFAFTAMFLSLAFYQLTSWTRVGTFIVCGAAAVSLALVLPAGLHLVAAGLLAFAVGYAMPVREEQGDGRMPAEEVETA